MLPIVPNINFDSDINSIDSNRAHMTKIFQSPIMIEKSREGKRLLKLTYAKIPMTVYNISSALGNNKIRYSMNGGSSYTIITFQDGIYTLFTIDSTIKSELYKNTHTEIHATTGSIIYPFILQGNQAISKGYLIIDTNFSTYTNVIVDIKNNSLSTFYLLYGFTIAQTVLDGSSSTEIISTNNINIYDSQFRIECNIIKSYTNIANKDSYKQSKIMYIGNLDSQPNLYKFLISTDDIFAELSIFDIYEISIRFTDRYGNLLNFSDDSVDSNILLSLSIY